MFKKWLDPNQVTSLPKIALKQKRNLSKLKDLKSVKICPFSFSVLHLRDMLVTWPLFFNIHKLDLHLYGIIWNSLSCAGPSLATAGLSWLEFLAFWILSTSNTSRYKHLFLGQSFDLEIPIHFSCRRLYLKLAFSTLSQSKLTYQAWLQLSGDYFQFRTTFLNKQCVETIFNSDQLFSISCVWSLFSIQIIF